MNDNICYFKFVASGVEVEEKYPFKRTRNVKNFCIIVDRTDVDKFNPIIRHEMFRSIEREIRFNELNNAMFELFSKIAGFDIGFVEKSMFCDFYSMDDPIDGYMKLDSFGNLQFFSSCLFIPKYVNRLEETAFIHLYNSRYTQKDRSENSKKGKENGCYYGKYFLRRVFTHVTSGEKMHIDMCVNDIASVEDRISEIIRNRKFTDVVFFLEMDDPDAMKTSNELERWYVIKMKEIINMRVELVDGDVFKEKYNNNSTSDYTIANPYPFTSYNIEIKLPKNLFD